MTTFERIKKLAKEHGMSLNELNDKAHLGTRSIYKWKYQEPSYTGLQKVAKVLHTTPDKLSGNDGQSTADLDDEDTIFTFQGKPIPEEDMKIIRRILNSDND